MGWILWLYCVNTKLVQNMHTQNLGVCFVYVPFCSGFRDTFKSTTLSPGKVWFTQWFFSHQNANIVRVIVCECVVCVCVGARAHTPVHCSSSRGEIGKRGSACLKFSPWSQSLKMNTSECSFQGAGNGCVAERCSKGRGCVPTGGGAVLSRPVPAAGPAVGVAVATSGCGRQWPRGLWVTSPETCPLPALHADCLLSGLLTGLSASPPAPCPDWSLQAARRSFSPK